MPDRYHRCNPIDASTSAESLGFCGREGFIIQRRCCSAEQARCSRHGPSLRCGSGSADVSPISLSGRTSRLSGLGDCKSERSSQFSHTSEAAFADLSLPGNAGYTTFGQGRGAAGRCLHRQRSQPWSVPLPQPLAQVDYPTIRRLNHSSRPHACDPSQASFWAHAKRCSRPLTGARHGSSAISRQRRTRSGADTKCMSFVPPSTALLH